MAQCKSIRLQSQRMNEGVSIQVHEGLDGLRRLAPGGVLSIGNFDGLHLGHRRIIETMKQLRAQGGSGRLAIATFEPHPLTVLRPELAPPRLTPLEQKKQLLAGAGIDDLVILPPTPDVLNVEAEQFWRILRDEARPKHLVEGSTFNFGKNRGGTIDLLRDWASGTGVQLHLAEDVSVQLLDYTQTAVNSTLIRWLIAHGRVRDAALCLGRPYLLRGEVIKGYQRGRTIGVPTANLDVRDQLIPADGVYSAHCTIGGTTYPVALSIGTLPTFGPDQKRQVEAHLLNFDGDLYGQTIDVAVLDWIRDQRKFDGVEALKRAIARDIECIRRYVREDESRMHTNLTHLHE